MVKTAPRLQSQATWGAATMGSGGGGAQAQAVYCRVMVMVMVVVVMMIWRAAAAAPSLRIGTPQKVAFREFVSWANETYPTGFAVDVFTRCMEGLDPAVGYRFYPMRSDSYDEMVEYVADQTYDGVVADLTITKERIDNVRVGFTQPYVPSTLSMLVPFRRHKASSFRERAFDFLTPFSRNLWLAIVGLFLVTAVSLAVVEHENPSFHALDAPQHTPFFTRARIGQVLWFTSMTLFFAQRSEISTKPGRIVMVAWLIIVLIITQSYTASLTSILTAQNDEPTIASLKDLKANASLKVGYQNTTFVLNYIKQNLGLEESRLVPLSTEDDYEKYLQSGGVAAILDESPYIQTFLASRSCDYTVVDSQVAYFGGFAFVFRNTSNLTTLISRQIIHLEQSGDLHSLNMKWLSTSTDTSCNNTTPTNQIQLVSLAGLFLAVLGVYTASMMFHVISLVRASTCSSLD